MQKILKMHMYCPLPLCHFIYLIDIESVSSTLHEAWLLY